MTTEGQEDFKSLSLSIWLNSHGYSNMSSVLSNELGVDSLDDAVVVSQSDLQSMLDSLKASNSPFISAMSLKQQIQFKRDFLKLVENYKQYKSHNPSSVCANYTSASVC